MRDINRLPNFYAQLANRHAEVPDMRFGQLMYSFIRWTEMEMKENIFYIEEDDFLKLYDEFLKDIYVKHVEGVNI